MLGWILLTKLEVVDEGFVCFVKGFGFFRMLVLSRRMI